MPEGGSENYSVSAELDGSAVSSAISKIIADLKSLDTAAKGVGTSIQSSFSNAASGATSSGSALGSSLMSGLSQHDFGKGLMSTISQSADGFRKAGESLGQTLTSGMESQFGSLGGVIGNVASSLGPVGVAGVAAAAGVAAVGAASVNTAANFQQSMANVASVTGGGAEAQQKLAAAAREAGATSVFSASQAGDAMYYLASSGYDTTQIISSLKPVMSMAAAGQMDLARASELTTTGLAVFGKGADYASTYTNVLAASASASNTNISQIGEAMGLVGGTAKSMGMGVEETAATLDIMANNGTKGAEAGHKLNSILGVLTQASSPTATKAQASALKEMGLSADDLNPTLHSTSEIFTSLHEHGMTAAQAFTIFGKENNSAAIGLADHASELNDMQAKISDTSKATDMAAQQNQTYQGSLKMMGSALEEAQISIGTMMLPAVTAMASGFSSIVGIVTGAGQSIFGAVTNSAGFQALSNLGTTLVSGISSNIGNITAPIGELKGALDSAFGGDAFGAMINALSTPFAVLVNVISGVISVMSSLGGVVTGGLGSGISSLASTIEGISDTVKVAQTYFEAFKNVISEKLGISDSLSGITGTIDGIMSVIDKVKTGLTEALPTAFSGTIQAVQSLFDQMTSLIGSKMTDMLKPFEQLFDAIGLGDMFKDVQSEFDKLMTEAGEDAGKDMSKAVADEIANDDSISSAAAGSGESAGDAWAKSFSDAADKGFAYVNGKWIDANASSQRTSQKTFEYLGSHWSLDYSGGGSHSYRKFKADGVAFDTVVDVDNGVKAFEMATGLPSPKEGTAAYYYIMGDKVKAKQVELLNSISEQTFDLSKISGIYGKTFATRLGIVGKDVVAANDAVTLNAYEDLISKLEDPTLESLVDSTKNFQTLYEKEIMGPSGAERMIGQFGEEVTSRISDGMEYSSGYIKSSGEMLASAFGDGFLTVSEEESLKAQSTYLKALAQIGKENPQLNIDVVGLEDEAAKIDKALGDRKYEIEVEFKSIWEDWTSSAYREKFFAGSQDMASLLTPSQGSAWNAFMGQLSDDSKDGQDQATEAMSSFDEFMWAFSDGTVSSMGVMYEAMQDILTYAPSLAADANSWFMTMYNDWKTRVDESRAETETGTYYPYTYDWADTRRNTHSWSSLFGTTGTENANVPSSLQSPISATEINTATIAELQSGITPTLQSATVAITTGNAKSNDYLAATVGLLSSIDSHIGSLNTQPSVVTYNNTYSSGGASASVATGRTGYSSISEYTNLSSEDIVSKVNSIPSFGTGGIVKSKTLAWVGESGAEAIVPLDDVDQSGNYNWLSDVNVNTDLAYLRDPRTDSCIAILSPSRSLRTTDTLMQKLGAASIDTDRALLYDERTNSCIPMLDAPYLKTNDQTYLSMGSMPLNSYSSQQATQTAKLTNSVETLTESVDQLDYDIPGLLPYNSNVPAKGSMEYLTGWNEFQNYEYKITPPVSYKWSQYPAAPNIVVNGDVPVAWLSEGQPTGMDYINNELRAMQLEWIGKSQVLPWFARGEQEQPSWWVEAATAASPQYASVWGAKKGGTVRSIESYTSEAQSLKVDDSMVFVRTDPRSDTCIPMLDAPYLKTTDQFYLASGSMPLSGVGSTQTVQSIDQMTVSLDSNTEEMVNLGNTLDDVGTSYQSASLALPTGGVLGATGSSATTNKMAWINKDGEVVTYDPRNDTCETLDFVAPSPTLKTSDPFYLGLTKGQENTAYESWGGATATPTTRQLADAMTEMQAAQQQTEKSSAETAENTATIAQNTQVLAGTAGAMAYGAGGYTLWGGTSIGGGGAWVGSGSTVSGWGAQASSGSTGSYGGSRGWGSVSWAEGGLAVEPTFGVFGEAGPELFIPLRDKDAIRRLVPIALNALGARQFAKGGLVGGVVSALGITGGDTFVFSPQISGGNVAENKKMLEQMFKKFKKELNQGDVSGKRRRLG